MSVVRGHVLTSVATIFHRCLTFLELIQLWRFKSIPINKTRPYSLFLWNKNREWIRNPGGLESFSILTNYGVIIDNIVFFTFRFFQTWCASLVQFDCTVMKYLTVQKFVMKWFFILFWGCGKISWRLKNCVAWNLCFRSENWVFVQIFNPSVLKKH